MKQLVLILIASVALVSCTTDEGQEAADPTSEIEIETQTEEPVAEPFVFTPEHPGLNFQILWAENEHYETIQPYSEFGAVTLPEVRNSGDSLIVSFWKYQWVGCDVIGDIRIEENNAYLLFCNHCPEEQDSYVEEEALLKFEYALPNDSLYNALEWIPLEEDLVGQP